jgi:hypothetical protein
VTAAAFGDVMGTPSWKSLPSWYLVATNDEAVPPDAEPIFAQRVGATVSEVTSSHVAMVSDANEVVKLTRTAVRALTVRT